MSNTTISYNAVNTICIRLMDFFSDTDSSKKENHDYWAEYDFVKQDNLRIVVEAWLRQNNIPFEEK